MTFAQAVDLVRNRSAARKRPISLVCGFEPLHLKTFLQAHFAQRFRDEAAEIATGLYGDLKGNLKSAVGSASDGAVLVIEWSDLDPRLGLRSAGGWGLSVQQDILANCHVGFTELLKGLQELAATMPVVLVPPTLPVSLFGHTAGWQASPNELELDRELGAFLAEASQLPRVSVLSSARLNKMSPLASRLDPLMELKAGFPYSLAHASILAGQIIDLLFPPRSHEGSDNGS